MSTMTKSNERPGVRARLSDARFSAYKAREVLDLIRGKAVGEARTILQFCERGAAEPIMKLLDSAVANAGNNNDIPPEELYVGACYADEGPTLKRWRPRARGRATRIRKRTCHITIIVSRYSAAEMDELRSRAERRGRVSSDARADRARRVARSRAPKAADETEADETEADETEAEGLAAATAEADTDDAVVEQAAAELAEQEPADQEPTEQTDADEAVADEAVADEAATEAVVDEANADDEDAGAPPADDSPEAEADEAAAEAVTEQGVRGDDEDDEES
jgi:large subunit ribosomal protein L22